MKTVIVTGANGFIGSSLIRILVNKGINVVAVDVSFTPSHLPESPLIRRIEGNVDLSLVQKIGIDKYDAFYHLAWRGVNGKEKSDPYIQLGNIKMGIDCANICKNLRVKRLLCAGTVAENSVFSLPSLKSTGAGMMYGVSKYACRLILEDYCKNIDLPFVWMQFSNIYGVGNKTGNLVSYTLQEILSDRDATFGPALQPYDFIYVDDLIEAIFHLGNKDGINKSFYYIGSGQPKALKDYLQMIGRIVNQENRIKIGVRPDDGIKYSADMFNNSHLIEEIGEYVKTDFEEGINLTAEWLKSVNRK